jgi:hypothetical protein
MIKSSFIKNSLNDLFKTNKTAKKEFQFLYNSSRSNSLLTTYKELFFFITLFLKFYKKKIKNKFFLRRFFKVLFLKSFHKNKIIKNTFKNKNIKFTNYSYLTFFLNYYQPINFFNQLHLLNTRKHFSFFQKKMSRAYSYYVTKKYTQLFVLARQFSLFQGFKKCIKELYKKQKLVQYMYNRKKKLIKMKFKRRFQIFNRKRKPCKFFILTAYRIPKHYSNFRRRRVRDIPAMLYNYFQSNRSNYIFRKRFKSKISGFHSLFSKKIRQNLKNLQIKIFFAQQKKKNYLKVLKAKTNYLKFSSTFLINQKNLKKNYLKNNKENEPVEFFNQLNYLINVNNSNLSFLTKKYFKKRIFINQIKKTLRLKAYYKQNLQKNKKTVFKFLTQKQFKLVKLHPTKLYKFIKYSTPLYKLQKWVNYFYFLNQKNKLQTSFEQKIYCNLLKRLLTKKIRKTSILKMFFKPNLTKTLKFYFKNYFKASKTQNAFLFKKFLKKTTGLIFTHFLYFRKSWEFTHYLKKTEKVLINGKQFKTYIKKIQKIQKKLYKKDYFIFKKHFFKKYYPALIKYYLQVKFLSTFKNSKKKILFSQFVSLKRTKKLKSTRLFLKTFLGRKFKKAKKFKKGQKKFYFKEFPKKIFINSKRIITYNILIQKFKKKYKKIYQIKPFNKKKPKYKKRKIKKYRQILRRKKRYEKRLHVRFTTLAKVSYFKNKKFAWNKKKINKRKFKIFKRTRRLDLRTKKFVRGRVWIDNNKFLFLTHPIFFCNFSISKSLGPIKKGGLRRKIGLTRRQRKAKYRFYLPPLAYQRFLLNRGGLQPINYSYFNYFLKLIKINKFKNLKKISKVLQLKNNNKKIRDFSTVAIRKIENFQTRFIRTMTHIREFKERIKIKNRRRPIFKKYPVLRYIYYKKIRMRKKMLKYQIRKYKKFKNKLLKKVLFKKKIHPFSKNSVKISLKNKFLLTQYPIEDIIPNQLDLKQVEFSKSDLRYTYNKRLQLFFTFIKKNKAVNYGNWTLQKNIHWSRKRGFTNWRNIPASPRSKRIKHKYYTKPFFRSLKRVIAKAEKNPYNHLKTTRDNVKRFKFFSMTLHKIFRRFMTFYQHVAYRKKSNKLKDVFKFLTRNLRKQNNLKIFYSKFSYQFTRKELFRVRKAQRKNQLLKLKFKLQVFFRHFYNYKKNHQLFLQLKYKKKNKKIFNKILNDFFLISLKKKNTFLHKNELQKKIFSSPVFINKLFLFSTGFKKEKKTAHNFISLLPYTFKKKKLLTTTIFKKLSNTYSNTENLLKFRYNTSPFIKKNLLKGVTQLNNKQFFQKQTHLFINEINLKHNFFFKLKLKQKKKIGRYYYRKFKKRGNIYKNISKITQKHYLATQYKKLKTLKPFFENTNLFNNYTLQYFKLHTQKQHLINTFTILESQLNILLYRMKFVPNLQLLPKMFFYNLVYLNNKIIRNPYHVVNVFELIQVPYIITKKFYFYAFGNSTNILKFSTQKSIFYFLKLLKYVYNPYTTKIWIPSYFTTNISIASGFLHSQPVLEYFMEPLLKFTKLFRNATKRRKQPFSKQLQILKIKRAMHKQKRLQRRRKHHRHLAADYCLIKLDFFNFLDFYNNY